MLSFLDYFSDFFPINRIDLTCISQDSSKKWKISARARDASHVKWGFEVAEDILSDYAQREYPVKFATFRKAVRDIEYSFMRRFSKLRDLGTSPSFQMVLCGLDPSGKASIYLFDNRGLAEPVHDNPRYAIIGSGLVTGGVLLLRLLGYTMERDLGILTTFIVDTVSEVDTAVGPFVGESYLLRIEEKEGRREIVLGPLKEEALLEFKEKSAKRKELIRKLWQLFDEVGEEKVEEALNSLSNKQFKNLKRKRKGKARS